MSDTIDLRKRVVDYVENGSRRITHAAKKLVVGASREGGNSEGATLSH